MTINLSDYNVIEATETHGILQDKIVPNKYRAALRRGRSSTSVQDILDNDSKRPWKIKYSEHITSRYQPTIIEVLGKMDPCNIQDINFNNMNLSDFYLKPGSSIYDCSFIGTKMRRAHLLRCYIDNCDFTDADLTGTDFEYSRIAACEFYNTTLRNVDFTSVLFRNNKNLLIVPAPEATSYGPFFVNPNKDGIRIKRGCRYFTLEEARLHWENINYRGDLEGHRAEVDITLNYIEKISAARGWLLLP